MSTENQNHDDTLQQQLLELYYGLLDEPEAEVLRTSIQTNADVAAAWAQTLKMADQFASAAKLEGVKTDVSLKTPDSGGTTDGQPIPSEMVAAAVVQETVSGNQPSVHPRRSDAYVVGRWIFRTMMATAASIALFVVGARFMERLPDAPQVGLRIQAEAIPGNAGEGKNQFRIVTSQLDRSRSYTGSSAFRVVPASISLSIFSKGSQVYQTNAETDPQGCYEFRVPKGIKVPDGSHLAISAINEHGVSGDGSITIPLEPTRCITYLTIDKPVYRPGETVRYRSLTLERHSMRPDVDVPIRFELKDPSGAVVPGSQIDGVTDRGVGNGAFRIPSGSAGGQYILSAHSLDGFFPDEEREVAVRVYRAPRFKKKIEFQQRSYGQGEQVQAEFSAVRAEGGPVAGARLLISANVDEETVFQGSGETDAEGKFTVEFELPEHISIGTGQLAIAVDDGGTRETQAKTIPIQLGRVVADFYPEGGYLVAGLSNRVYFTARNTLGDPVHIAGEVLSSNGQKVADLETTVDGMGRFEFTPAMGDRYMVKVTEPIDVHNSPQLPSVVSDLPVMETGKGVFAEGEDISLVLRSMESRELIVQAVCRGKFLWQDTVQASQGAVSMSIPVKNHLGGVVRVTVLDPETTPPRPLVERLVYCRKDNELSVKLLEPESALQRSPGEKTRLNLQVLDSEGNPTPAIMGVSVVDDVALSMDTVERPSLRTHFMLTSEVDKPEDLEHADLYLADGEEAEQSLDLLLGTQGWRRFASGTGAPNDSFREQLARLIKLDGKPEPKPREVDNQYAIEAQWTGYLSIVADAWGRMWADLRVMIGPLLLVWLLAFLVRPRQQAVASMCVLIAFSGSWSLIVGCGSSHFESADAVATNATPAMEEAGSQKVAEFADDMDMAPMDGMSMGRDEAMEGAEEPHVNGPEPGAAAANGLPGVDDPMEVPDATGPPIASALKEMQQAAQEMLFGAGAGKMVGAGDIARDGGKDARRLITDDDLRRLLQVRGLNANDLGKQLLDELRFPVRQYSHYHRSKDDGVREDFAETLYWQPLLITDSSGLASIRFDLSDSVTTYRVLADAHTMNGRLGSGGGEVISRIPLQFEPKLPLEVTVGDRIDLPVAVINATGDKLPVELSIKTPEQLRLLGEATIKSNIDQQARDREYFALEVRQGASEQDIQIEISGQSGKGDYSDTIRRSVHIAPAGYPIRHSIAGTIDGATSVSLPIPEDIVAGSLAIGVRAYPSPLADIMTGVESILREPHGCFEQTSATNYPNAMALQYLREAKLTNPQISKRALGLLNRGYGKLTSFECSLRGYEWFGSDPGHEALSAFGLMQFTDMGEVMDVDAEMMVRTRTWLMNRRNGQGGFHRNPRHLHVWSVDQAIVDAYVLWALTEADVRSGNTQRGASELAKELDHVARLGEETDDPYLLALAAASMMNVGRTERGEQLLDRLTEMQGEDGLLDGNTTVTQSGGISRKVETTALGVLAFAKNPAKYGQAMRQAAGWIVKNRQGHGGFGSTQATVLALKAMVTYTRLSQTAGGGGAPLKVVHQGKVLATVALPSNPSSASTVEIVGLGEKIGAGESMIQLVAEGVSNLPFSVEVLYHTLTPPSDEACPLELTTELIGNLEDEEYVQSGGNLQVKAVMENTSTAGLPMTVATIGLPGGLEPRAEQLDEMREAGVFDYYELRSREVICYWRTIEPEAIKEVVFDVTATVPGQYTGPASRAYLYYTAEQKYWCEPMAIKISK